MNQVILPDWIKLAFLVSQSTYHRKWIDDFLNEWSSELQVTLALASTSPGKELVVSRRLLRRIPLRQLLVFLTFVLLCSEGRDVKYIVFQILDSDGRISKDAPLGTLSNLDWLNFLTELGVPINPDYFFAQWNNRIGGKKGTEFYSTLKPTLLTPKSPRRMVRKRGYSDHGSLGSSRTGVLKTHIGDWELVEQERKKETIEKIKLKSRGLLPPFSS